MEIYKKIRFVLIYTLILNALVALLKIVFGFASGSLAMIAVGFDSMFDGISNVIGLVGIYVAFLPPDVEHPYGHKKFETLFAIGISVLLFVTCYEIVESAIHRFFAKAVPDITWITFVVMLITIAIHIYVAIYEYQKGKKLKSDFLVADSMHTRADVFVSLSVVAGFGVIKMGYPWIDPLIALGIAILIAKIGIDIIRSGSRVLVDGIILNAERIEKLALSIPGVKTCHRIRSRVREDHIHLDLHLEVDPKITVDKAHDIAHGVEEKILKELEDVKDVVIHIEPKTPSRNL